VNQVDLENCCFLPKELIEFAKAHRIELLTHGDRSGSSGSRPSHALFAAASVRLTRDDGAVVLSCPAEIITTAVLRQHLKEHGVLPAEEIERLELLWVLRYSVFLQRRGVASDKAYLIAATVRQPA